MRVIQIELIVIALIVIGLVVMSIPEIRRYIRMRRM